MTRKQMKKLAKELYECELIHNNDTSSEEEKDRAERRIIQLTGQIMCLRDGMDIMSEIDLLIQSFDKGEN